MKKILKVSLSLFIVLSISACTVTYVEPKPQDPLIYPRYFLQYYYPGSYIVPYYYQAPIHPPKRYPEVKRPRR